MKLTAPKAEQDTKEKDIIIIIIIERKITHTSPLLLTLMQKERKKNIFS